MHAVLATLAWDPQIRGAVILLTAFTILCGSVWLLLATNVGARLGFLLAAAGLTGWLMILGMLWTVTPSATGPKGRDPVWKVKGVVSGNTGPTAPEPLRVSLQKWTELPESDAQRAEITTAAEEFFKGDQPGASSFGIAKATDYIVQDAWSRGGGRKGPGGFLNVRPFDVFHDPHFAAVRIYPTVKVEPKPGEKPPEPKRDFSRPPLTVLLERDLGTRRVPGMFVTIGSGILFFTTLSVLHRRDKEAMAARGLIPAKA